MDYELEELASSARSRGIPIMLSDGIDFLCDYIRDNNIINILEIGSAIGYSAIRMALVNKKIKIITIERDSNRYFEAIENIKRFGLDKQIQVILGDAMDVDVDSFFDLIFIDASKGHNIDFFERYKKNLNRDGVIITDNLLFHGLVSNSELIKTKNQRKIVDKIKNYITFLNNNLEFSTVYFEVGDGLSLSRWRGEYLNNE